MIFTKKFITSLLCISCSFLFIHSSSFGFVQTKTGSGLPLKWPNGFKVNFAGNPTNQSSIHPDYFFQVIAQGLQKWKSASGNAFNFDYWQGTSSSTYIQNSQYNGQSSIYFVSQSTDRMGLDSGVLGYTQVWYNTGSGEILETDIVLNDYNFFFTPNPQDSHFNQNSRRIFIENVVTHELGHVFGLSHSSALQDTMLYVEAPEQNTLSCNEWTGIRSIYATGSLGMGKISGSIVSQNNNPVFGAHVYAISSTRGVVFTTAITDKNGNYTLSGLEPGNYYVMAEPYLAGGASLSEYYTNINPNICNGSPFGRTFLTLNNQPNSLQSISVGNSQNVQVGSLTARCSSSVVRDSGNNLSNAKTISIASGYGGLDQIGNGNGFYKLTEFSGNKLVIHALSYTLFSAVQTTLKLYDRYGNEISSKTQSPVFHGDSGITNYNSSLIAENLYDSEYYLQITSNVLNSSAFPMGNQFLDPNVFYVFVINSNPSTPQFLNEIEVNSECENTKSLFPYQSPGGLPPRNSTLTGSSEQKNNNGILGFCGTIQNNNKIPPPSANALWGWFSPFLFMFISFLSNRFILRLKFSKSALNIKSI